MSYRIRRWLVSSLYIVACLVGTACTLHAEDVSGADRELLARTVERAIGYLETIGQADDGSYSAQASPAVTALVTTALLRHGLNADDPLVAKSLSYLRDLVQSDGGIYKPGSRYRNYETCLSAMCFQEANDGSQYDELLAGAERFVTGLQWDETEGRDLADFDYGGGGYGSHERPDLSNTAFLVEALHQLGNGPDDPAIQKALVFVSRCQNLETAANTTPFAAKVNDGGFYYTPAAGGQSQAGETPNGGLRSYASMTYAGLKSMIFAGVGPDDPRVKAALEWISKHYALDSNPGMGAAGLYYYYHTFAKALDAVGQDVFVDAHGTEHDWRRELVDALSQRQQNNGSWINEENTRWLEGDPNLVTGYALLALSYCRGE